MITLHSAPFNYVSYLANSLSGDRQARLPPSGRWRNGKCVAVRTEREGYFDTRSTRNPMELGRSLGENAQREVQRNKHGLLVNEPPRKTRFSP